MSHAVVPSKKWKCWSVSHVQLFATAWTVARQTPLFMEFSRQEYWSGYPFPSLGDLPNPGVKPGSPAFAGGFFTIWAGNSKAQWSLVNSSNIILLPCTKPTSLPILILSLGADWSISISNLFLLGEPRRKYQEEKRYLKTGIKASPKSSLMQVKYLYFHHSSCILVFKFFAIQTPSW